MDWRDEGIVLAARRHGETSAVVHILTRAHGRHGGLVRGASGKAARGLWQPGNLLDVTWRGRLEEHLGQFTGELLDARVAGLLGDRDRLACLASVCALAENALPEREPHPLLFEGLRLLIGALARDDEWAPLTVRWEAALIAELGYGLDLSECAATGATEGLEWVSPRTGRAVSDEAGAPYADRLLPLPGFLIDAEAPTDRPAVVAGLRLTGFFLERRLFPALGRPVPPQRARFLDRMTG
ncbi:DNA recombination and repair protein RecO [Caenispirillum salinarum AK4]|uniref:DNA repair protein RecO n=1 Tax=Caenispirillum salinarum AK4 TaxID=1238182 RepID=K9HM79_9PROT|nr:DNA repair protein RecO [Caenispirillum salinarum]EKV31453.1 DNA recombination and repair protein RecO [Caenispirillum salinarum AK4]